MAEAQRRSFDVVVVGGGAIGLACAWRAAQRGLRVVVADRGGLGAATSRVAAGMLAPVAEAEFGDGAARRVLELGLASAARYPGFVAELADAAGADPGYLRCGTLLVARDRDEAEALDRELAFRRSRGLAVERLRPSEARAREPALAPALRLALEAADDHAVDPRALCAALADATERAGGELRPGAEVAEVLRDGDRVHGVRLVEGERLAAEQVLVAAGPWSARVGGIPAEATVPVRPVKGQILRLHDPAGPGLVGRTIRMSTSYLVPRGDGRYVLGATMEERGFDADVTAGAVFELLRDAAELVPGVGELVVDELGAGLRPGTPDNAPIVGPGALHGLVWATGHYRNGILLTPVTADLVAALLAGEDPGELAAGLEPGRFATTAAAAGVRS